MFPLKFYHHTCFSSSKRWTSYNSKQYLMYHSDKLSDYETEVAEVYNLVSTRCEVDLCASSRINRFFVQLHMSFCPFTHWGVFGSDRITGLWWVTKKMCMLWATLLIQLHQLQEVCMRQGILVDCWLMSLLLRYIDWKVKYIFCCGCVNVTGWHKLGLNSLLWGTAVRLACLTTEFRHNNQITCGKLENWDLINRHKNSG